MHYNNNDRAWLQFSCPVAAHRFILLWASIAGMAMLAACEITRDEMPAPTGGEIKTRLRVMAFNIEWGGTHVSFGKVVEAIKRASPDIVAVQEAEGNLARLAHELDWHYDLRNHIISPHRLIDPPGAGGKYVFAEVEPGRIVAVANVHLPSDPYGEYWIADGHTVDQVTEMERRVRLPSIEPFLTVLAPLATDGIPVFLAGDFNSPSHRDWRAEAIRRWPYRRYVVEWPVATAIEEAGFRDSYRRYHEDPLEQPGFTWWAGRPRISDYNPGPDDSWQSRIDFIWYAGPAEVHRSTLVGERNAPGVTIDVSPWPSDHRAVLSDFIVEAADMTALVAAGKRVYREGEPVNIEYMNRANGGTIVITPLAAGEADDNILRIAVAEQRGTLQRDEGMAPRGAYEVALYDSGDLLVSRNEFWVLPDRAKVHLETTHPTYLEAEPISLAWRGAPGNRYDWIVIYPEDNADRDAYVAWAHIDAQVDGTIALGPDSAVAGWPLAPGRYVASMLADDGYKKLAGPVSFEVRAKKEINKSRK